jgi:hypothetical protein
MTIQVFQPILNDKKVNEISGGWDKAEWSSAYMNLTGFPEGEIFEDIKSLVEHDIYRHTMTVDSSDLEQVFMVGNMHDHDLIAQHQRRKSVSVGDILVDTETGVGHMVAMRGFIAIAPAIVEFIKARTAVWEMA